MVYIVKCSNEIVTDYYLKIIGTIFLDAGWEISYVNSVREVAQVREKDIFVIARLIDAIYLATRRKNEFIYWAQGIEPEESYMRHGSKLRYICLSNIEKFVLKRAKFIFFVSKAMKKHYEEKYKLKFLANCVMPCFNTSIHKEAFFKINKYKNNVFVYAGSLSVWQNFEETVLCYKKIEMMNLNNTKFLVLTSEIEKATTILTKSKIKNFEIKYIENDILSETLADAKYGFILRKDITVNRVATPTKLSTYLSCGLIPIYSTCLLDFSEQAEKLRFVLPYNEIFMFNLEKMARIDINPNNVYADFERIFREYYNSQLYVNKIVKEFQILNK